MSLSDVFKKSNVPTTAKKVRAKIRPRNKYNIIMAVLVILLWVLSDPDLGLIKELSFGSSTIASLLVLIRSTLYVTLLHYSRKTMLDYLDLETLFKNAMLSSDGSGKAIIGVGLIMISISIVILAATV